MYVVIYIPRGEGILTRKLDTKDKIIRSVYSLVTGQGISRMTMDSVAEEAGMSKGGLFYHFPTKEVLIESMLNQIFNQFDEQLEEEFESEEVAGGRTRSYLKTTFLKHDQDENEFVLALLAALVNYPELLTTAREYYHKWQSQLENDQTDPVDSTIVRLATDGLWFSELFGLAPIDEELREQVFDRLTTLTKE